MFEYDKKPQQYKLIGGLVENTDVTRKKALEREIAEEVDQPDLELGKDYFVKRIEKYNDKVVSYTYGAYADYDVHYYLVDFADDFELNIGDKNKWLTSEELEKGRAKDGKDIYPLDEERINMMERQSVSIKVNKRFDPIIFIKEYWQEAAAVAALISVIIGALNFII